MRVPGQRLWVAAAVVTLTALLFVAGCGGGGGSSSSTPIDSQLFTPNYISSLDVLLHWNHLPMRVSFEVPSDSLQTYGWGLSDCTAAANEWNQSGGQALITVVPYGSQTDVVVHFVPRSQLGGGANSTGVTTVTYNPSSYVLATATVKVAPESPFGGWMTRNDIKVTIAHELGHALGIHGHSPYTSDLMCAVAQMGQSYQPSARDLNTAMSAYASYFAPGVVQAQKTALEASETLVTRTIE